VQGQGRNFHVGKSGSCPPPLYLSSFIFFLFKFPSLNRLWIFRSELFLALLSAALFLANTVDEPVEVNLKYLQCKVFSG
jgi:hypothetical protein